MTLFVVPLCITNVVSDSGLLCLSDGLYVLYLYGSRDLSCEEHRSCDTACRLRFLSPWLLPFATLLLGLFAMELFAQPERDMWMAELEVPDWGGSSSESEVPEPEDSSSDGEVSAPMSDIEEGEVSSEETSTWYV